MIHSFLEQLTLGVDPFLSLERLTLVGFDLDGRVHIMHSLFSVRVDLYLTRRRLFACLGELPTEGLPPVVEIPNEAFAARRSVFSEPQMDNITHLGGIDLPDWQTNPCEREVKTAGAEYVNLACRGLNSLSPD